MKVYEALANAFVKEGVTTVFGLMGNGNMYWWHTLDQHPDVAIHETRHEGTALTMAEGWARATRPARHLHRDPGPGPDPARDRADRRGPRQGADGRLRRRHRAQRPRLASSSSTRHRFVDATEAGFVPIWKASGRRRGGPAGVLPSARRVPADRAERADGRPGRRTTTATSTSTSRRPRCCRAASGSSRTRTCCARRPASSPRARSRSSWPGRARPRPTPARRSRGWRTGSGRCWRRRCR